MDTEKTINPLIEEALRQVAAGEGRGRVWIRRRPLPSLPILRVY